MKTIAPLGYSKKIIYNLIVALCVLLVFFFFLTKKNDMIYVSGGAFTMGTSYETTMAYDESPKFNVAISGFYVDPYLVSVSDYKKFIQATNYQTDAEKFGNSIISDLANADAIDNRIENKRFLQTGAYRRWPIGLSGFQAIDNYPVTQVSRYDADAYCKRKGKRLPTEIEREFVARNGGNDILYPWGNVLQSGNKHMANLWQPGMEKAKDFDGFTLTSPIDAFPPSSLGIYDIVGNVRQRTDSDYMSYPLSSSESKLLKRGYKVQRGGSFLCNPAGCHGFRVGTRMAVEKSSASFHAGFRCVRSD